MLHYGSFLFACLNQNTRVDGNLKAVSVIKCPKRMGKGQSSWGRGPRPLLHLPNSSLQPADLWSSTTLGGGGAVVCVRRTYDVCER